MKLLDESSNSSSSDEEDQPQERLQINQKFAGEFERRQRFKDLQRAKELLAMDGAEEEVDSEDEESEDEDAELLSPGLDLKIIQTINQIRKKDPKIYDKSVQFFEQKDGPNGDDDSEEDGEKQGKKKRYKDVLREQLLQGGADMESSDEEGGKSRQLQTANKKQLVYDREQEDIRKAFLAAAKGSDQEDSDEEVGDVLKVKKKSAAEQAKEEEELKRALQEMKTLAKDEEADKEDFLTTYFTNKMWKDTTGKKKSSNFGNSDDESEDFEHDENALEEAELFESKYNFRFEEMQDERERREKQGNIIGAADTAYQVVGHARNVQGTLRRQDDSRKLQREQRKERKEKEKRQKEEELKRLKNLKKQEVSAVCYTGGPFCFKDNTYIFPYLFHSCKRDCPRLEKWVD